MGAGRAHRAANARGRLIGAAALGACMLVSVAGCGGSSKPPASGATQARTSTSAFPATTASGTATGTPSSKAATASAGSGHSVTASAAGVSATLLAGTHTPKVNANWPIHITVTQAGRPARATVVYQYLFAGQVVAHRSHYVFSGRFSDVLQWPVSAVGYQLTFRAVITSAATTIDLDYPVQVHR